MTTSKIVTTVEEMYEMMNRILIHRLVSYDLETSGISTFHGDKIVGVALSVKEGNTIHRFYIPLWHKDSQNAPPECWDMLQPMFEDPSRFLEGWNLKFDIHFAENNRKGSYQERRLKCQLLDVMLGAHLADENARPFQLKHHGAMRIDPKILEAEERLSQAGATAGVKAKAHMAAMPVDLVAEYAMMDVELNTKLREYYTPILKEEGTYGIWQEVSHYSKAIQEMEFHGVKIDVPECKRRVINLVRKMREIKSQMIEIVGYDFNPNSVPQLCAIFKVPKGPGCTNEEALLRMKHPLAPLLLEYRHAHKAVTTYYSVFVEKVDRYSRLHTSLLVHGTISSRLSSRDPNLQAVTAPDKDDLEEGGFSHVREVIIAEEGYTLVEADYNQAELRMMAHFSKDPFMVRAYTVAGLDIHTETSNLIGVPRPLAKRVNFGIVYGLGAPGLAKTAKITEKEAAPILQRFHERAPGIKKFYKKCEYYAEKHGHIKMWTGRRRHFTEEYEHRKACSNFIQGGVAEMIRIAIENLYERMKDEVLPDGRFPRMILTVHDSILFEIPTGREFYWIPIIKEIMEDFQFSIPMIVDIKMGQQWGGKMTGVDIDQIKELSAVA